jgi:pilus assembly protein Flp/PilA
VGEENRLHRRRWTAEWLTREGSMHPLTKLLRCERGANAIEYALVASLISIAALLAFENLGTKIDTMYNNVSNHMN